MEVNIKEIEGAWDLGCSLDKHTISSTPIGYNEYGYMQYDTVRPEAGEALFQLKYRSDFTQVQPIAQQLNASFGRCFASAAFVVPMPASKQRARQPVTEIAREFARLMSIPCHENLLVKNVATSLMKDISSREEKVATLLGAFSLNDILDEGSYDVIIVDDLFDTGSSLEAATMVLREYSKINSIFVATVTRKS